MVRKSQVKYQAAAGNSKAIHPDARCRNTDQSSIQLHLTQQTLPPRQHSLYPALSEHPDEGAVRSYTRGLTV